MNYKPNKGNNFVSFIGSFLRSFCVFFVRLRKCSSVMSKLEHTLVTFLLAILIILLGFKGFYYFKEKTVAVPAFGGTYKEVVVGELKYLNPILASNDADKSVSKLLFSSLLRYDKDNNILPDIAERWEVSPDGLKYVFYLRSDAYFHDGKLLTSQDVIYTISEIKNPELKSPLYELWKDVDASAEGEDKLVLTLPKAYGPFIFNCDFGILPSHINPDEFTKKSVGTGPFEFVGSKAENNKITSLSLKANGQYYKGRPNLQKIEIDFFQDKNKASQAYLKGGYTAVSGVEVSSGDFTDLSLATSKRLALIFNLRSDKFKDKAAREKILNGTRIEEGINLSLTTLDSPLQKQKAEEIKQKFAGQNINLTIKYCNSVDMLTVLEKKDYEILLYGFDFGHDRDPYIFWHSSQLNKSNYAGYADRDADILLEDSRMVVDNAVRNQNYDNFFNKVQSEFIIVFYEPIQFDFAVDKSLRGVEPIKGNGADSRYYEIEKWFLKEQRVRK